jgi:NAD(P)H dehydrogenase (quinone)
MPRSLIVAAHPEPTSFAMALAATARDALAAAGREVVMLDLYAEGFDPVLTAGDFTDRLDPGRLRPMEEQHHAAEHDTFEPLLARHIELLRWADLVVLAGPMWWFSIPAMLKGWIDRVFANGVAYDYPAIRPWTGPMTGKRSMLVLTSSYEKADYRAARVGTSAALLYPLQYGTLAYTGMSVMEPFIAYAADTAERDVLLGYLDELRVRMAGIFDEPALELHGRE